MNAAIVPAQPGCGDPEPKTRLRASEEETKHQCRGARAGRRGDNFCPGKFNSRMGSRESIFAKANKIWTDSVYVSTGGSSINPGQEEILVSLFQTYPDATIIQAGDNDEAGDKHSATIASLAGPGRVVERDLPSEGFKDWNAELLECRAALHRRTLVG